MDSSKIKLDKNDVDQLDNKENGDSLLQKRRGESYEDMRHRVQITLAKEVFAGYQLSVMKKKLGKN